MSKKQRKSAKETPELIIEPKLSEKEKQARSDDIELLCQMRDDRDKPHPELDGMTYVEFYESNRKKDLAYLPPKKNKQDVRFSSGVTREKDTTMVSTILNLNFVPDITAFDIDNLVVQGLGDSMSDWEKKSREVENWQKKEGIIERERVSQGDVFVLELYTEDFREQPLEAVNWDPTVDNIADFSMNTRVQKVFSGCTAKMINGKKVYLGSMQIEDIEDQDVVAIVNIYSRSQAFAKYRMWERWKNVPTSFDSKEFSNDGDVYKTWNMVETRADQVAEVFVFNKTKNRAQIYLNGTPMLPYDYLLTNISPSGDIPMGQGKFEPISDFAYSKGQPSKTKVDEELLNEASRLMILAMRQGGAPTMGSRSKKVYSRNIFVAGKVISNMKEGELYPLFPDAGLKPADFSFYQLIKQGIDEKTVNDAFTGDDPGGDPTATQVTQEKEQQMMKLGLSLDGAINFRRRLSWLRIYNMLANWTKKQDKDLGATQEAIYGQYKNFTVQTNLENGQKGMKLFRMTTDQYPTKREMLKEEKELEKKYAQNVRIVYMNPEMLQHMKYIWFILITATPKNNDVLSQVLFVQNIRQGFEMFGPESFVMDYLKQRWSVLINEDYSKLFKKVDIMEILKQKQSQQEVSGDQSGMAGGAQSAAGVRKKPLKAAVQ